MSEFRIYRTGEGWIELDDSFKPKKMRNYMGVELFSYFNDFRIPCGNREKKERWTVTEVKTGARVGGSDTTREDAIRNARSRMLFYSDIFHKVLDETLDIQKKDLREIAVRGEKP